MITEGHHYFNNETDFWTVNKDRIFLRFARYEKNILDIGCGKGSFLKELASLGISCEGIDFSKTMIEAAKKNCQGYPIKIHYGDFMTYNLKKKYDCIIFSGVIEHIEDDNKCMKKIYELLNPNGKIILLTSAHPWLYSVFDKSVHHYRRYSKKQLRDLLEKNGFVFVSSRYWDILGVPYLIYARIFKKMLLDKQYLTNNVMNSIIDLWFRIFENNINPPFGLNLFMIARK